MNNEQRHRRREEFRTCSNERARRRRSSATPDHRDTTTSRANGSVLAFDGFYKVWGRDENGENELPSLAQGEALDYHDVKPEQHFTQPPPRYTEATLIKELEQRGIGRPSTYAPTVETIKDHGYVEVRERRLHPTHIGEAVNSLMVDHFKSIADDDYTAKLEKRLDEVESGKQEWVPVVRDFYGPLQRMLSAAEEATPAETDEVCPQCGEGHLVRKASRFGPFLGCSRYPKCKYRRAMTPNGEVPQPKLLDEPCPTCGRPLQLRTGRYGEFVGCSGYPECKYIKRDAAAESKPTGEKCPQCGEGDLVERTGRYGPFVACSRYPECKYRANMGKGRRSSTSPARSAASRWSSGAAGSDRSSHAPTTRSAPVRRASRRPSLRNFAPWVYSSRQSQAD